jgi:RNA polymerase sigma factor (sigma-70 family)
MTPRTIAAPNPDPTDEELAAQGDLTVLYGRYARRLPPFLATLGVDPGDLDDMHHEVWLRVCGALGKAPFEGHFRGWLFRVARNLVIDQRRRHRAAGPLPDGDCLPAPTLSPAAAALRRESLLKLARCLEQLSERDGVVFRGITGGADYDELCQRLEISKGAAYKHFHQAKSKLASCLERSDT